MMLWAPNNTKAKFDRTFLASIKKDESLTLGVFLGTDLASYSSAISMKKKENGKEEART